MPKKYSINWVLLLLLGGALVLRLWGIWYGLPSFFIGDEPAMVYGSLKMLQLKTLLPVLHAAEFRPLYYPPLIPYLLLVPLVPVLGLAYWASGVSGLGTFTQSLVLNPTIIWLTARTVAALLGTATVYAVYRLGRELFNRNAGLFAAALIATSFLHVQMSHFIRHWVAATLCVTVVAIFAVRIANGGKKSDYVWAGIVGGLGFGVSYVPVLSMVLVVLAHWMNPAVAKPKIGFRWLWVCLGIAAALSAVFIALHPQEFFRMAVGEDSTAAQAKSFLGLLGSYQFHLRNFLFLEPVLFLTTLGGAVWLWFESRKKFFLLLTLPVVYLTVLYVIFHDEVRYLLLVLPLFCAVAGNLLEHLWRRAAVFAQLSAVALVLLVFAFPLTVDGKYLLLLTGPDTRQDAEAWIAQNIPAGNRVVTDLVTFRLASTKDSILQQQQLDPGSLRQEDQALLQTDDAHYPTPAWEVLPLHFISSGALADMAPESFLRAGFQYLVVEDSPAVRPQTLALIAAGARVRQTFTAEIPDLNGNFVNPIFTIFPVHRLGPTVTVYQLP
ncbi:MAG: glycosyltransferase family 39 protein [Patescibacteria group bacterium]|nr:glycosyltransferase family 39 protein [Patescibacteria group bacterium]